MSTKILICDDVAEIRLLLKVAFHPHEDLQVIGEAADGREAVAKARELEPDVVLLDINMPHKNGLEALEEIRGHLPHAKVVMFTGFESSVLGEAAREMGAHGYIEKGTPVEIIIQQVRAVASA